MVGCFGKKLLIISKKTAYYFGHGINSGVMDNSQYTNDSGRVRSSCNKKWMEDRKSTSYNKMLQQDELEMCQDNKIVTTRWVGDVSQHYYCSHV